MTLLRLAAASLRSRALVASLTTGSIALTVALVMSVAAMREGVEAGFTSTLAGTDLIVGARGGPLQILLFTVFGIGSVSDNVSWEAYERWSEHKAVAWAVPVSLGDNHHGFRVVGTNGAFFDELRLRGDSRPTLARGEPPQQSNEVALGSETAEELGYEIGHSLVLTHGMGVAGISDHDDHPFVVRGILAPTRTPFDRSLIVTLQGLEAIHGGSHEEIHGGSHEATHGHEATHSHEATHGGSHEANPHEITAFFVGTHNPFDVLHLQRDVQEDQLEPLSAVLPGVTMGELWRALRVIDIALWTIFFLVAVVSLAGLTVALLTSLQERRREMAVLRALGVRPHGVVILLVLEAGLLTSIGTFFGLVMAGVAGGLAGAWLETKLGVPLPLSPSPEQGVALAALLLAGWLVGLVPAYQTYREALSKGLGARL